MEKQFGVDTLLFVQRKSIILPKRKQTTYQRLFFKWQGFDDLIIYT